VEEEGGETLILSSVSGELEVSSLFFRLDRVTSFIEEGTDV